MTVVKNKHPHPFRRPLIVCAFRPPRSSAPGGTGRPGGDTASDQVTTATDEGLAELDASIAEGFRLQNEREGVVLRIVDPDDSSME